MADEPKHVVIVGAGFTGAAGAILLSRYAKRRLLITLIDPASTPGRGLAYTTHDPHHRLNGPDFAHVLYPDDPAHFPNWLRSSQRLKNDPEATVANGWVYARRRDFGDYIETQLQEHQQHNRSGSSIRILNDKVVSIDSAHKHFSVTTDNANTLLADQCFIATGHEPPGLPNGLITLTDDARVVNRPFTSQTIAKCDKDARIVLLGLGLTAADIMTTLVSTEHKGRIVAVSRSGRTPTAYHLAAAPEDNVTDLHPAEQIWQMLIDNDPAFVQRHGRLNNIRQIVKALRRDMASSDEHWSTSFDSLRNSAHAVWPLLSVTEKRRYFRHLKRRYDVHRYRYPPPTKMILDKALSSGQIEYKTGVLTEGNTANNDHLHLTLTQARETESLAADLLINCTAANQNVNQTTNPSLRTLLDNDLASASATGVGFAVNPLGQSIDSTGNAVPGLYLLGPPVYGELGEAINVPFISRQIFQIIEAQDY